MQVHSIKKIIDTAIPILGVIRRVTKSSLIEGAHHEEGGDAGALTGGTTSQQSNMQQPNNKQPSNKSSGIIGFIIFIAMMIYSLYLHISCKNRNAIGFIPAIFCPCLYLITYATTYNLFPFVCPAPSGIPTATPGLPTTQ